MNWILALLAVPATTGLMAWRSKNGQISEKVNVLGGLLTLSIGLWLSYEVWTGGPLSGWNETIYVDALSAWNISLIAVVGFAAALYSVGYMRHEVRDGVIRERQLRRYYLWFHLFLASMLAASVFNNLGLYWVGIELTTLVSALLVAFYQRGTSLEAAWKYLIMGSVGIAFALLGIIFLYVSGLEVLGESIQALNWTTLLKAANKLNADWIWPAFIFVLVGLGTKAGLAPMHFWLPDAHSQAPSPISAVLSGVLLNTAFYGIFRVYVIANETLDGQASQLLVLFGLLSIGITVPFILVQHDLKRMLAYSSVEHMGIIALGVGIGGSLGLYGAILHMFNHSMTKSLLFFTAGLINQTYHSKRMDRITGILKTMPVTGSLFLLALFAIAGAPPFNIFLSEITIMMAGFQSGHLIETILFAGFVIFVFAGMIYYGIKISYGQPPAKLNGNKGNAWSVSALLIPLVPMVVLGWHVPSFLTAIVQKVTAILQGVQ